MVAASAANRAEPMDIPSAPVEPSMNPPPTSRALVTESHGGPEVVFLRQRPIPEPGPGQVRVRIHAAAFNHLDLWVRRGIPAGHWPVPLVPCADGAGVIDAVGPGVHQRRGAEHLQTGAAVVLYPVVGCGTCPACLADDAPLCPSFGMLGESTDGCARDHVVLPAASVMAKPDALSFAQAAAMPTTFLTAWRMLRARARLQAGETVLVHGGRSGVGSAAIVLARLLGARVIATVRRPVDVEQATALGAEHVLRSDDSDWPKQARALCKGGVQVVIEHIGGATWQGSMRAVARGGRIVLCGATAGHEVALNLRKIFFHSISILGSTMGSRAELVQLLLLAGQGQIEPAIGALRPLAEGADAMQLLDDRAVFGKVILDLEAAA